MRYILAVLAFIFIMALSILWIFGGNDAPTPADPNALTDLSSFPDNGSSEVSFRTEGKIEAKEEHHEIEITITPSRRTLEIYRGYDETVIRTETYDNTRAAYDAFITALDKAGVITEQQAASESEDGVCPTGNRYIFEAKEDGRSSDFRRWAVSCSSRTGNMAANRSRIEALFKAQIPEYTTLVRGIRL